MFMNASWLVRESKSKASLPLFYPLILFSSLLFSGCSAEGINTTTTVPHAAPGIIVSKTVLSTSEDGTEESFSVALATQPSSDVSLTFTSRDLTEGKIGSDADVDWDWNYFGETVDLDFTPANWNIPKIIKVQGQTDSLLDGNQTYNVANTWVWSLDLNYINIAQPTVSVTNVDTSAAGVTVSTTSLTTAENGNTSQYFTVKLNVAPTSTVEIPLTISDASEGSFDYYSSVTEKTLTFDENNWSSLQYIYINDVDDVIADGNQTYAITLGPITSADLDYNGLTGDTVSVTNTDDDAATFTVSALDPLQTNEWGQTASFTVVLNTEPTADVIIPVTSPDVTEGQVSTLSAIPGATLDLTFTPANWQIPQTVTVNPVDDADQDGDISYNISIGAPTGASEYTALIAQTIAVVNTDDDTAKVNIQGANLQTTEAAGTDTFVVSLAKEPTNDVVINISTNDTTEGRVKGGSSPTTVLDVITLTFTTADWQTEQTVTVVGQDDFEIDGNKTYTLNVATDTALTLDADYDLVSTQSVSVTNADNDVAGLTVTGYVYTYESGTTDIFTVNLTTKPTADVTVPLTVGDQNEFLISSNGINFSGLLNLTFTTANWSTPQTITVQAIDDYLDETTEYYDITIGSALSADLNYEGLPSVLKEIGISDNDTAGFAINPSTGLATSENGTSASFTVALTTEPVTNVSVTISSGNVEEGLLTGGNSPSTQIDVVTLEFSPADWQSAQAVTIHGQDDIILDGPIAFDLTVATITGTDSNYNNVYDTTVGVINSDNEPTSAEGTTSVPVDLTSLFPYSGLVDTTASYYMLSGLSVNGNYDFTATSVIDDISLYVYSNNDFNTGLLCSSTSTGTNSDESCRATTGSGTVYIKIDGALTVNGASFVLDATPVYTIETFPNGSADTVDTVIELYHVSDLANNVLRNDDGGMGSYSKITTGLSLGETYYLKVIGYSVTQSGAYSVWFTNTVTTPTSAVVPTDNEGEPGDDTSAGATLLTIDTVVDRTISTLKTGDEDWFVFTVPTP